MSSNYGAEVVSEELTAFLARLGELADAPTDPITDGGVALVDQIATLERLRSAVAAAQHTAMVASARSQVELQSAQIAAGSLDPRALGRGIGDQIGLAAHVSPHVGSRRLGVAQTLAADLPVTRGLSVAGRISEQLAEHVVSQTSHLDPEQRRLVDKKLADTDLEHQGRREAEATVKKTAYEVDRAGYTNRGRTARKDRRVTLRAAPHTMSVLSGLLPVEQGVACIAALRMHADSLIATGQSGDRTRDQIITDTRQGEHADRGSPGRPAPPTSTSNSRSSCRSTRSPTPTPTPPPPANSSGTGRSRPTSSPKSSTPPPARPGGVDCSLTRSPGASSGVSRGSGSSTACSPNSSTCAITGGVGSPTAVPRTGTPTTSTPARDDGPTSLGGGRGTCARHNYDKELPGWHHQVVHDGLGDQPHTVRTTTPTGHTYTSRAGP